MNRFPIDALKIDKSFVQDLETKPAAARIVSALISMGKSLNIKVIAEGVETLEQLAFLKAHQCPEVQGYYFSRPLPGVEFAELLAHGVEEKLPHPPKPAKSLPQNTAFL